ncbi:gamma-glutamylcyclotransferase family protein [Sphingobium olei]|uniref:Gamma-glutamylcyclotransferase n=1 Tax=Sphingobium olei TaxID=420955 RepID=A0ABW3P249_9SPHN|nr:gamma-glutamylcyclotransferase [Sphingobium sp.]
MTDDLLFVYGTLRKGCPHSRALRLAAEAAYVGAASASGHLYRVADYPGFVPGSEGRVCGDLFRLARPHVTLAWLDEYEECAPHFPAPHEYRRQRLTVDGPHGGAEAWTYVYALPVGNLEPIDGGDFLACAPKDGG